jgi:hypothetical protein
VLVALTDNELLDFDLKRLGGLTREPRSILEEHGDAYRNQLVAARWIERWAEGLEGPRPDRPADRYFDGMAEALRDVAAHLRQGDLLPGGVVYEDIVGD